MSILCAGTVAIGRIASGKTDDFQFPSSDKGLPVGGCAQDL
jgi:hypothetical protein